VEVRIGVQHVSREITLETDMSADKVAKAVADAMSGSTLDLTDDKGRRIVIPGSALGYVEIGEVDKRRVGFGG
jgi:hypothetical protein